MKNTGLILTAALLLTGMIYAGSLDEKKGTVTYASGQVKRSARGSEDWQNAPVKTNILEGDKVRTYQNSRAELDLAELDIIRLAQRTIIDIVQLYKETKEKRIKTQINIEEGEIWANIEKKDKSTEFSLSAPIAAAAITGTVLRFKVGADTTTQLKVYSGEVHITNAPEKKDIKPQTIVPHEIPAPYEIPGPVEISMEEWVYIVKSMEQITIDKKGKILSKGRFGSSDSDEQNEWIRWNHTRDTE
jgi:hypothetical protein